MSRILFALIFICILTLACKASATSSPVSDSLYIQLLFPSNLKPGDCVIRIKDKRKRYKVNKEGVAIITDVPAGDYMLIAEGEQIRLASKEVKRAEFQRRDTIKIVVQPLWLFDNSFHLNFAQHSFSPYWKAGGISSVAVGFKIFLAAKYQKEKTDWQNSIDFLYGIVRQGKHKFNKNVDQLEFNSKYNVYYSERWNFSTLVNFRSSMHNNYKINTDGSRGDYIGGFLSPAFANIGTGVDYKIQRPYLNIYYSPVNTKITHVADRNLASQYLPVGFEGQRTRIELGSFMKMEFKMEVLKNVFVHSKADFFTNHIQGFGNIDVNWENVITLKVNDYLSANFFTQLIYDDDIKFEIADAEGLPTGKQGPRTQFRESFNVGLMHRF